MAQISRVFLALLVVGTILGLLGQELFYAQNFGFGVNGLLMVSALVLAIVVMNRKDAIPFTRQSIIWLAAMLLGSLGWALNDSRGIDLLNFFLVTFAFGLVTISANSESVPGLKKWLSALILWLAAPFLGLSIPFLAEWKSVRFGGSIRNARSVAIGLVLAIPFVAIFGSMLVSADPVFANLIVPDFSIDVDQFVHRLFLFGFVGATLAGAIAMLVPVAKNLILGSVGFNSAEQTIPHKPGQTPSGQNQTVIAATFLWCLAALFGFFVAVQFRYLFGGNDYVLSTHELTFAEYARKGFFELTGVIALSLPLLVLVQSMVAKCANDASGSERRRVIVPAGMLSVLMFVILGSAAYRMSLYVDVFGLTPLRVYVSAGIAWLAMIVLCYGAFGLRWRLDKFGIAAWASVFLVGFSLNLLKPDALIASVNLSRPQESIDRSILVDCGADAHPVIMKMAPEDFKNVWKNRMIAPGSNWKTLSLSEHRARQVH